MFSGSRLKECRMEKHYSQSELANLLKINRRHTTNGRLVNLFLIKKIFLPLQEYLMFQQPILNQNTRL